MADLSAFPITRRWTPAHPDRIQYYGMPTPNGVKVSIMLEETGLPYEVHKVSFAANEQKSPEFLSLNPNGKIPAILDPDGPDGVPIGVWESGAILVYLADRAGRLLPAGGAARQEVLGWLWWQVGGLGPIAGQLNFFARMGGKDWEDKRPRDRFADEVKRLLGVLDGQLGGRDWIAGDYSIADIACLGWVRAARTVDKDAGLIGFDALPNLTAWLERGLARPAVQRGLAVPA
ncbi:glutathione S-transferase family protein [uncultured Sphingomonas sp.]|uniref:glutathione S-transferase family protein n=1 Tax=uncultured Sphingomonas sp. TaxID=158754 RepID=UPI0035CB5A14